MGETKERFGDISPGQNPHQRDSRSISDRFDIDLAYEIGDTFGKAYETWVKDNQHRGSKTKARQLVTMWHQEFSGKDTPEAMVSVLEGLPAAKSIIDKIKKLC